MRRATSAGGRLAPVGESQAVSDVVMDATRALVGVAAQSVAEVSDEVSLAQLRVLVLLDARGEMPMGDLAELLAVNPSTATRVCDVLEDKGYVSRAPDESNRRVVLVTLTRGGRSLVQRTLRRRRKLLDAALGRMSEEAQQRLARSLAELTDALGAASEKAWTLGWSGTPHDP